MPLESALAMMLAFAKLRLDLLPNNHIYSNYLKRDCGLATGLHVSTTTEAAVLQTFFDAMRHIQFYTFRFPQQMAVPSTLHARGFPQEMFDVF